MARQKQSGCQHLSPKTRNWEPCVGPDGCDYRKQGLDVPHAYNQAEREAIDAERAGVDDAGLGGSRASEPSAVKNYNDSLNRDLSNEIETLERVNNKRIEDLKDYIKLNIENEPRTLEITTNTSDKTLLVYGLNGDNNYFSFNLDDNGKIINEEKHNLDEDSSRFDNDMSYRDVKKVLTYQYQGKSVYIEDHVKDIMNTRKKMDSLASHNGILRSMRMPDLDSKDDPVFSKMGKFEKEQYFNATVDDL
jgi:hypothetical protein